MNFLNNKSKTAANQSLVMRQFFILFSQRLTGFSRA